MSDGFVFNFSKGRPDKTGLKAFQPRVYPQQFNKTQTRDSSVLTDSV